MIKNRFLLSNIFFYIAIVIGCLIVENVNLFTPDPQAGFDFASFCFITVIFLVVTIIYLYLEHKKNKLELSYMWICFLSVAFIFALISIWSFPYQKTLVNPDDSFTLTLITTNKDKLSASIQLFITFVIAYLILVPFKKSRFVQATLRWVYRIYILVSIIFALLSLYLDFEVYKGLFLDGTLASISSIYTNPNFFGMNMLTAILALIALDSEKVKSYRILLMIMFGMFSTFSGCASTTILSGLIVFIYFMFSQFYQIHRHLARSLISLSVFLVVGGAIVGVSFILYKNNVVWLKNIVDYIYKVIINNGGYGPSLSARENVWKYVKMIFKEDPKCLFIGYGYKVGSNYLHNYLYVFDNHYMGPYDSQTAHSAIYEMIIRGGIVGLVFYLLLFVYFFYCIVHLYIKKQTRFATIFLLCFLVINCHGIVESTFFFEGNIKGITSTLMFYLPVIAKSYYLKKENKESVIEFKENTFNEIKVSPTQICQWISSVISIAIMMALSLFVGPYFRNNSEFFPIVLYVTLFLIASCLLVPYLVSLLYKNASKKRFVFRMIYLTTLFVVINTLVALLVIIYPNNLLFKVLLPFVNYLSLIIPFVIYFIALKGNFDDWFKNTFIGAFKNIKNNHLLMIFVSVILFGFINSGILPNILFNSLLMMLFVLVGYFISFVFIRSESVNDFISYLNQSLLIGIWDKTNKIDAYNKKKKLTY